MLKSKYDWAVMAMDREYFSLLVPQDRERQAKERLETMLIEGLESGLAEPMTAQDWEEIRMAVRERRRQCGKWARSEVWQNKQDAWA
ncbi:MAG: hypothetical protein AB4352_27820 [Hormoscilla sp.]